jgi:hypothetical protein
LPRVGGDGFAHDPTVVSPMQGSRFGAALRCW